MDAETVGSAVVGLAEATVKVKGYWVAVGSSRPGVLVVVVD